MSDSDPGNRRGLDHATEWILLGSGLLLVAMIAFLLLHTKVTYVSDNAFMGYAGAHAFAGPVLVEDSRIVGTLTKGVGKTPAGSHVAMKINGSNKNVYLVLLFKIGQDFKLVN